MRCWKERLIEVPGGRALLIPYRFTVAVRSWKPPVGAICRWLWRSREITNFTYAQSRRGVDSVAHLVSCITGLDFGTVRAYAAEFEADNDFRDHIRESSRQSRFRNIIDPDAKPGRRLLYYLLARAAKPRATVEAGVDHGLGTCIIAAALARNAAEGSPGRVWGVDIRPGAGWLFGGRYAGFGETVTQDATAFLQKFDQPVDLFLFDCFNDRGFERKLLLTIEHRLTPQSILVSSWHNGALMEYAQQSRRRYLVSRDEPRDHWYRGSEMGVAFPAESL